MEFKSEIKIVSSSKAKLIFVKVPDSLDEIWVDHRSKQVRGMLPCAFWESSELPNNFYKFIGLSHKLTDEEIDSIFASRKEFYQICNLNDIFYNYSAYTGKWVVLSV